jgi:drug/metabolite transporter (DMT)-like permease
MTIPPAALAAVLLGALLHASWNLAVRAGRDRRRETALVVASAAILAIVVLPFLPQPSRVAWPSLGISAALHVVYFALIAEAYSHGEVSLAYPLMRGTAPMLTAVLAWAVLGEQLSPAAWLGIAIICGGVVLMAHRKGAAGEGAAIRVALANAVVIAAYTLNDATGARASGAPVAYTLWIFPLIVLPVLAWLHRGRLPQRPSRAEWLRGVGGGACSISAYALALWAMTVAPVAPIAALREASMLFGIALARIFLGERPGRRRWGAAAAIRVGARIDRGWRLPSGFAYQTTRTETGMPSRVIRLSTLHPIFASVR